MKKIDIQRKPFVVPAEGGKRIEEHFGLASIASDISLAHMVAPPGWSEPFQTPEFDEYTYVIRGRKQILLDGECVILHEGQSIKVHGGTRVQYSNPFEEACEYLSICSPAFSIGRVHRES